MQGLPTPHFIITQHKEHDTEEAGNTSLPDGDTEDDIVSQFLILIVLKN